MGKINEWMGNFSREMEKKIKNPDQNCLSKRNQSQPSFFKHAGTTMCLINIRRNTPVTF